MDSPRLLGVTPAGAQSPQFLPEIDAHLSSVEENRCTFYSQLRGN
jgi:hypothetical protein